MLEDRGGDTAVTARTAVRCYNWVISLFYPLEDAGTLTS